MSDGMLSVVQVATDLLVKSKELIYRNANDQGNDLPHGHGPELDDCRMLTPHPDLRRGLLLLLQALRLALGYDLLRPDRRLELRLRILELLTILDHCQFALEMAIKAEEEYFGEVSSIRLDDPSLRINLFRLFQLHSNLYRGFGQLTEAKSYAERCIDMGLCPTEDSPSESAYWKMYLADLDRELDILHAARERYSAALQHWESLSSSGLYPSACLVLPRANCLSGLGAIARSEGDYATALPYFQRALRLLENPGRPSHPGTPMALSQVLNNLGCLYSELGWFREAESLHQRQLQLGDQLAYEHRPAVAAAYENLAIAHENLAEPEAAIPLMEKALELRRRYFSRDDGLLTRTLANLARLQARSRQSSLALQTLQDTHAQLCAKLPPKHRDVAQSHFDLGNLYAQVGLRAEARSQHAQALELRQHLLPQHHLLTTYSRHKLAELLLTEDSEAALDHLEHALADVEHNLAQLRFIAREPRLAHFLRLLSPLRDLVMQALLSNPSSPRARALALTALLQCKGRTLDVLADRQRQWSRELPDARREQLDALKALQRQIAKHSMQAWLPPLDDTTKSPSLAALQRQAHQLEEALLREQASLHTQLPPAFSSGELLSGVAAQLGDDAALIEFVAIGQNDQDPHYLALLLTPQGGVPQIELADLGTGIDQEVEAFRQAIQGKQLAKERSLSLHARLWQPLTTWLGSRRRIFLGPDGALQLLPFSALHDGNDYLLGQYEIVYVSSGRDLVRPPAPAPEASAVILAGPEFAGAPGALPLAPLPGALAEGQAIQEELSARLPRVELYTGDQATEERLSAVSRPAILHLATHGVLLGPASAPAPDLAPDRTGPTGLAAPMHQADPTDRAVQAKLNLRWLHSDSDPMLRSALALAQAGRGSSASAFDGLVTALELASMDLSGTQLVALSACHSGEGEVRRGDGLYGLRRAALVAGGETVLASLWPVDDHVTCQLMKDYYRRLLSEGGRRAWSLQQAAAEIAKHRREPYYWAAFLVLGNPGPLRTEA